MQSITVDEPVYRGHPQLVDNLLYALYKSTYLLSFKKKKISSDMRTVADLDLNNIVAITVCASRHSHILACNAMRLSSVSPAGRCQAY